MDYVELRVKLKPFQPWAEILTSQLAEQGFESFTEEKDELCAYIPSNDWSEKCLENTFLVEQQEKVEYFWNQRIIKSQNWNATWESEFQPVSVGDDLFIFAPFHEVNDKYTYKIEIQPQMSFGTGHHQTTWLLSKRLLEIDFSGKTVLDVGTGTGVLAILAKLLGASQVMTTEIDAGSCENALENFQRNDVPSIKLIQGDIDQVPMQGFDVIIANINKNVLKKHLPFYAKRIKKEGTLLLSGFFETDIDELKVSAEKCNFNYSAAFTKEGWAVLEFNKKD